MTPKAQARQVIDERLRSAGWQVQDYARLNLGAAPGVAECDLRGLLTLGSTLSAHLDRWIW